MGTEETPSDKLLKTYLSLFKIAWKEARPFFDLANEDAALYNQDINPATWPTLSEITLGDARKMVDQIMPAVMMYMFGANAPFQLIPADKTVDYEVAEKVRKYLLYTMLTVMKLESKGEMTIKTAVKLGSGYGIVEPKIITPPTSVEDAVIGRAVDVRMREMRVGEESTILSYNNIPFGNVIPTPDGTNPDEVSCTFVLRQYNEHQFRKMMKQEAYDGPVDEIIKTARLKLFNGYLSQPRQIAANIAGYEKPRYENSNSTGNKKIPVIVPVFQCYAPDEHVFFACDKYVIYHKKNKFQTLRSPVIKATFDPEPETWFSAGIIRPRFNMINGVETFINSIMDIMTQYLHPHQLINVQQIVNEVDTPDYEPYAKTRVIGPPATAVSWVFPPTLPDQVFRVGDIVERAKDSSAGQPASMQGQGSPGLVRGGSGAMESLYERISGREKLSGKHLENGWYLDVIENSLILAQLVGENESFQTLGFNTKEKKNEFITTSITKDEIRHIYRVHLTFLDKMRNKLAEASMRQANYDRLIQNEEMGRSALADYLISDERVSDLLKRGADREANLATMQQLSSGGGGVEGEAAALPPGAAGAGTAGAGLTV